MWPGLDIGAAALELEAAMLGALLVVATIFSPAASVTLQHAAAVWPFLLQVEQMLSLKLHSAFMWPMPAQAKHWTAETTLIALAAEVFCLYSFLCCLLDFSGG